MEIKQIYDPSGFFFFFFLIQLCHILAVVRGILRCGPWTLWLWRTGLAALWHVGA